MNPLISCIVHVFNGERYLREAPESILAQTHRPLEIIVADVGSTDWPKRLQLEGQVIELGFRGAVGFTGYVHAELD